jgi:hypothetical protein
MIWAVVGVAAAVLGATVVLLRRHFVSVLIEGTSMEAD